MALGPERSRAAGTLTGRARLMCLEPARQVPRRPVRWARLEREPIGWRQALAPPSIPLVAPMAPGFAPAIPLVARTNLASAPAREQAWRR